MADSKVSALSAITTLATTDEMLVASSGASKKITAADLRSSLSALGGLGTIPFIYKYATAPTSGELAHQLTTTTAVTTVTDTPVGSSYGCGLLNDGFIAESFDDQAASSARQLAAKYNGTDPDVHLDLGAAISIKGIYVFGIGGNSGAGVVSPSAVKLESSDDDSSFSTVENRTGLTQTNVSAYCTFKAYFDCTSAGSHRYWRYTSTKGTSTWTVLSEIIVVA